jgi:hypothetical protein
VVGKVIYVRVNAKEQTENPSLPMQLRACEEDCRRQGYEILERFHEEGKSAKSRDRRFTPSPGDSVGAVCGAQHRACARIPTFRCAASFAASPVDAA